jgi:TatA/E family protein of Tat protein translocase
MGIGDWELFMIAVIALLLFGNKLPAMMGKLGSSVSQFKRAMDDTREKVRKSIEEPEHEGAEKHQAGQPPMEAADKVLDSSTGPPPGPVEADNVRDAEKGDR